MIPQSHIYVEPYHRCCGCNGDYPDSKLSIDPISEDPHLFVCKDCKARRLREIQESLPRKWSGGRSVEVWGDPKEHWLPEDSRFNF